AYFHTWLVVGHLLGINYDALRRFKLAADVEPLTYLEMQVIRDVIFRRQAAPSASGQVLTRALLKMQEQVLPKLFRPLPSAAIRYFIGDDAADMLEVPPAGPVRVLLNALGPAGAVVDWVTQGHVLRPTLAHMTGEMFRRWIADSGGPGGGGGGRTWFL